MTGVFQCPARVAADTRRGFALSPTSSRLAVAAALLAAIAALPAQAQTCSSPVVVLEDPQGDYSNDNADQGAGLPEQDLLSLEVAELEGGLIKFTLKVQPFAAPVLPPNAVWYTSFENPEGDKYGVRMETDGSGAERMYSYLVATGGLEGDGPSDGRFVETETGAAEAGSGYSADGTITLIAKASSLGVFGSTAGQTLGPFNAATLQGGAVPPPASDAVSLGFATTVDTMPGGLARDGFYDLAGCGVQAQLASGSGLAAGAISPHTIFVLIAGLGLGLARRRRAGASH